MNSIQQVYTLNEQQCAEVNLAAEYILNLADPDDREMIARYGECLARNENDVHTYVNGIAALFRSGVIEMAAYRVLPDDVWEALERAIALSVFSRLEA